MRRCNVPPFFIPQTVRSWRRVPRLPRNNPCQRDGDEDPGSRLPPQVLHLLPVPRCTLARGQVPAVGGEASVRQGMPQTLQKERWSCDTETDTQGSQDCQHSQDVMGQGLGPNKTCCLRHDQFPRHVRLWKILALLKSSHQQLTKVGHFYHMVIDLNFFKLISSLCVRGLRLFRKSSGVAANRWTPNEVRISSTTKTLRDKALDETELCCLRHNWLTIIILAPLKSGHQQLTKVGRFFHMVIVFNFFKRHCKLSSGENERSGLPKIFVWY